MVLTVLYVGEEREHSPGVRCGNWEDTGLAECYLVSWELEVNYVAHLETRLT